MYVLPIMTYLAIQVFIRKDHIIKEFHFWLTNRYTKGTLFVNNPTYFCATKASSGNCLYSSLHHSTGDESMSKTGYCMYTYPLVLVCQTHSMLLVNVELDVNELATKTFLFFLAVTLRLCRLLNHINIAGFYFFQQCTYSNML